MRTIINPSSPTVTRFESPDTPMPLALAHPLIGAYTAI